MTPKDIIAAARVRVWNRHPYVSAVLMTLRPVEMPGLGTIAVDKGWRLYYDPKVVQEWGVGDQTKDGTSAVLAHEVWHVLREHFKRQGDRDPEISNLCMDAEINDDIVKARWNLPGKPILPQTLGCKDGQTFEEMYDQVTKNGTVQKLKIQVVVKGGAPGTGGKCGGCCGNAHDFEKEHQDGDGQKSSGNDAGKPDNGSLSPGSKDAPLNIPEPVSQGEQTVLVRLVAQAIQQMAKQAGNVPAGLRRWADEYLEPPKIDWRKQLAAVVRGAVADRSGASDYTWRRPSRRSYGVGAAMRGRPAPVMPAYKCPLPKVGVVLDVSGSMSGTPQGQARAEIMGILKALAVPVEVYVTDTRVAAKKKVRGKRDIMNLEDTGGGTDLRSGIKQAADDKSDVCVVLTDGFTAWSKQGEYRMKIVAAITQGGEVPPPYIPHVMIEE